MARNIEIKARIASVAGIEPAAAALADGPPVDMVQDDTFFRCDAGRLKLRTSGGGGVAGGGAELIFYRREDLPGPKESFYLRSPVTDPASLREALASAYGITGRVRKRRTLYLAGRTRIHLDRVEGLGDFLELEVVLCDGETSAQGMAEAGQLMRRLGIGADQLLDRAYVDLIALAGVNRDTLGA